MRPADPNKSPLRFRKLRIAWSVGWGIMCVLLIVLWVRSYWRHDCIGHLDTSLIATHIGSNWGVVYYRQADWKLDAGATHSLSHRWRYILLHAVAHDEKRWVYLTNSPGIFYVGIPHWFLVMPGVALAGVPWFLGRFSLRTLLIATTLVAVVLGLIVWLGS
jgi:hypothetical protein